MAAAPGPERYGAVARAFHWMTAISVFVLLPTGVLMTSAPLAPVAGPLYIVHKGLGSILLVLVGARTAWRLMRPPPPLPLHVPRVQQVLMHATHWALYLLLLIMVASGYVRTVADGFPIELLETLGVGPMIPESAEIARVALVVHKVTAYTLTALVATHVAAAADDILFRGGALVRRMGWRP